MESNNLKTISTILSDIQSSINAVLKNNSRDSNSAIKDANTVSIVDCSSEYKRLCAMILRTNKKWNKCSIENISDTNFIKDYMFIYNCISNDLAYMKDHMDQDEQFINKFIELKYEIRKHF